MDDEKCKRTARAIISAGASEEALRLIIASNRVNDDLRDEARKLLIKIFP